MIRIGVIGLGRWGPNHVRVFSQLRGCVLAAVTDADAGRRTECARRFGGIRVLTDAEELLRSPEVDAVVVATPTRTHGRLVRLALRHGKHVLCEKPLCASIAEGKELARLARKHRRVLMTGHVFLFNPGVQKVCQLLRSGQVGRVRSMTAVRTNLGPVRHDVNAAWDLASHDVAIFNWLLGLEPVEVQAMGACFLQRGIEDVVNISMRYPGNVLVTIQCSWLDPKKVRQITVVGSKKMVTWDDLSLSHPVVVHEKRAEANPAPEDYGQFLRISLLEGDVHLPRIAPAEPLQRQAEAFLKACRTGRTEVSGPEFSLGVVRTLGRIQKCLKK